MKTTDFLTELSNTKLGQYKTAAGKDATAADKAGNFKRGNKRMSGITNATKKEFANDAAKSAADAAAKTKKVDEGVNISPDQIQQMFQGAQKIGTAGGNNRSMIGKAKDMFSKPNTVAAPGTRQYSNNPKSITTPNPADQAATVRQQKQTQAAQAAQARMTPAPAAPVATPAPVAAPADPASYKDTFPKAAAASERDKTKAASTKGAVWKSNRNPMAPAKTSPTELSESQIYRLIGRIVNKHKKQVDEGIMDWARTKGQNITNKITADKLLQAWKKAGSSTDSDDVAKVMTSAGVPQETVDNLMKNFVQGPSASTNTNMWQGVDRSIPAIQRKAQAAAAGVATTDPAASTASSSTPMPAGWRPSDAASSGTATTSGVSTTNTAKVGKVGAPTGKQAVDQAIATVKSVRGDRRPQVANYGKQQFDALAQVTAKQPAATVAPAAQPSRAPTTPKTNNTIAMPKQGEKIKWGGQEFKPGDPMYDQMKAAGGVTESLGLNYPETYEQTNDKFKSKGQRRTGTLTTEQNYDSGDYSNARMGREYGKLNYSVDSGASHFEKERVKNQPGGELGRPRSLAGASKALPADPFSRTTGQIPKGKTGKIHKVDMDEGKQRIDTRVKNYVPIKESAILQGLRG